MLYWVIFLLIAFAIGLQLLARYEMSAQRVKETSRRTIPSRSRGGDA
jgi:hypothetical protein